jgi:hypothetical protein
LRTIASDARDQTEEIQKLRKEIEQINKLSALLQQDTARLKHKHTKFIGRLNIVRVGLIGIIGGLIALFIKFFYG